MPNTFPKMILKKTTGKDESVQNWPKKTKDKSVTWIQSHDLLDSSLISE
jgi:hypothetical protein